MQKTLKALAAIGVLSCVGYVMAQSGQVRSGGGNYGGQGGSAVASKNGQGKFAPANAAQQALRHYITAVDNRNVELARRDNKQDVAQACVEVQCYYILATMKPDERKHEVDEVWEISKYRPNGQWNHITSAPMLVDELLRIDPKVDAQIKKIVQSSWDSWMEPFMGITRKVNEEFKGKTWATMTPDEKTRYAARCEEERAKVVKGKSNAQISSEHVKHMSRTMDEVRKVLTKSQAAEFDRFIAAFDRDMSEAFAGSKHAIGSKGG